VNFKRRKGDWVGITGGGEGVRFLLVSGRPIREPVAWYGPIVMNNQEELRTAFPKIPGWHVHEIPRAAVTALTFFGKER